MRTQLRTIAITSLDPHGRNQSFVYGKGSVLGPKTRISEQEHEVRTPRALRDVVKKRRRLGPIMPCPPQTWICARAQALLLFVKDRILTAHPCPQLPFKPIQLCHVTARHQQLHSPEELEAAHALCAKTTRKRPAGRLSGGLEALKNGSHVPRRLLWVEDE